MRRCQVLWLTANQRSIAPFFFELVELRQVTAGTIHKKAQQLKKQINNRDAFFVFSHGTKHFIHNRHELNTLQIGGEQCQPGTVGNTIIGCPDRTDVMVFFAAIFCTFRHRASLFFCLCCITSGNFPLPILI